MAMVLTIILVNWNTKDELMGCLDSIAPERERTEMEVFVVDNGSQDGTPEAVKGNYSWVHFLGNEENLGFARAVNMGLGRGRGRYMALINPDTRLKEGCLERLISFMETHPEAGVAGAQLLNGDGSRQNSVANFPSLATELLNKRLLRWFFPEKFPGKERTYREPLEVDSVIGACMVVRREAMEQVGLLDEGYFLFLEETDWCYRMKRAGWKVYHVPGAEISHFQGGSASKDKKRAKLEYYRSRYHFFKKNRGRIQGGLLLVGLMIRLTFELAFTGLTCILTVFAFEKSRRRLLTLAYLVGWHLKGCPEGMGLKKINGQ
jgi:GT2 family glycosyltransferase